MTIFLAIVTVLAVVSIGMCVQFARMLDRQEDYLDDAEAEEKRLHSLIADKDAAIAELAGWEAEAVRQRDRANRCRDRARGWQNYARSLERRNDDEVIRRNTEAWMTPSLRDELDARFEDVIAPLLGGEPS